MRSHGVLATICIPSTAVNIHCNDPYAGGRYLVYGLGTQDYVLNIGCVSAVSTTMIIAEGLGGTECFVYLVLLGLSISPVS